MSLIHREGDLWSYVGTHRIVVTTNTLGVMGAGVALAAKKKYPGIQTAYQAALRTMDDRTNPTFLQNYPDVILVPTKNHFRDPSPIALVAKNLERLSLLDGGPYAMPELGCGLGGLVWCLVAPYAQKFLAPSKTEFVVVHPIGWGIMR